MAQDATTVTWLTQDAFDRLTAELEELSTTGREEIAKRIEAAREEGDLKENGGYHAAKDEQGKIEARIRQLKELLKTAEVGEAPASKGVVESGFKPSEKIAIFRIPGSWENEGFKILDHYGVEYCDRRVSMYEAAGRAVAKMKGA